MKDDNRIEKPSIDLEPITSYTMADRVETHLREYIRKKGFKPGDLLPKELEIAEALGVSRNIVREALSRLRMLGMIESRKRRGMVLATPDILGALDRVLDPHILTRELRQELYELRLILEVGMADFLFSRKTDKDLQKLEKIVEKELKARNEKERIDCDIEFHATLYKIAGNTTISRFQKMLRPVFDHVMEYEANHGHLDRGKVTHKDLIHTLRTGTPEKFREDMRSHLSPHFEHVNGS